MAPEPREWSVPAPVSTLLWWPAVAFVLVIVDPDAAVGSILVAGAALAALGGLLNTAAWRLRRSTPTPAIKGAAPGETTIDLTPQQPTTALPTVDRQPA